MFRPFNAILVVIIFLVNSCGTPNDPESIDGNDGGYKVISRLSTAGFAQDITVSDTLAFVAQGEGGIIIISLANPYDPREITTVGNEDIKGYSYKVTQKDSILYIATGNFGVSVINVVDPKYPEVTATNLSMKPARDFYIMGDFLFTSISELGVKISNISFPAQPDIRGGVNTPGFARGVCASQDSNYLLVTCGEMGFASFDISQLQNGFGIYPMIGWIDTPGYAEQAVTHPTLPYAYVASGTGGLSIIDFTDPENLQIVGAYSTGGYAKEVFYYDDKIFVTTELRGLQIFDVSNPVNPIKIGTVHTEYALGVSVNNGYVYVADEVEGLIIIAMP